MRLSMQVPRESAGHRWSLGPVFQVPRAVHVSQIVDIVSLARRVMIGAIDTNLLAKIQYLLDAQSPVTIAAIVKGLLVIEQRHGGIELGNILGTIHTITGVAPETIIIHTTPGGTKTVVIEAPEAPKITLPEMDLTIKRDRWPEIIRATSKHMLAYGWPGTGKSYDFAVYAAEIAAAKTSEYRALNPNETDSRIEHEEVNCTRQTSAAGWIGHWIDGKEGFEWSDGAVARAMKNGVPLVINDIHLCSDDLFDLLFFVLDIRPGAKLSLNNGTHLTAREGFRALMSMNGDPLQVLDEPIRDRIVAKYPINEPSSSAIKALDRDVRKLCAWSYANAKAAGPRFTYRTFQSFCQLRRELGNPFEAAALACEDSERARAFLEPLLVKDLGKM